MDRFAWLKQLSGDKWDEVSEIADEIYRDNHSGNFGKAECTEQAFRQVFGVMPQVYKPGQPAKPKSASKGPGL